MDGAATSAGAVSATLAVTAPSKSGGGEFDWLDMMFVVGVLLAGRRYGGRPPRATRKRRSARL
jgi:hypothetical protein